MIKLHEQRFLTLIKYWVFTSFLGSFLCIFANDTDGVFITLLITLLIMLFQFVIYYFNFPCIDCKFELYEVKNQELSNEFYENINENVP